MTVWHWTGSVSFIRSHIALLTPAARDRRVKGCWQVLIAKKDCRKQGMILYLFVQCVFALLSWYFTHCTEWFLNSIFIYASKLKSEERCVFTDCSVLCLPNFLFAQALQLSTQINVFVQKSPFQWLWAYQHSNTEELLSFLSHAQLFISVRRLYIFFIYLYIDRKKNRLKK